MLEGNLKTKPLQDLLQEIGSEKKTGILFIESQPFEKKVVIQEGSFIFLMSNDPKDMLGHYLVSKGVITEEQLIKALALQNKEKQLLGALLKKIARLSEEDLFSGLQEKLLSSFLQLFHLADANFKFTEEELTAEDFPAAIDPVPLQDLIATGMKQLEEYKNLKKIFPTTNQTFNVNRDKVLSELNQVEIIAEIIDLMEQGKCIEDLILHMHAYEYLVLDHLNVLLKIGAIEKNELSEMIFSEEEKPPPPQRPDSSFNLTGKEILEMGPNDKFEGLKMEPIDGFVLSRVNGSYTVGEIVAIIPLPENEALAAILRLLTHQVLTIKT